VLGARLDFHHEVQARFAMLDREAQLVEAGAEHRRVVVKGEKQIAEVIGLAVAIVEQDGVVDHERDGVGGADPPQRIARGIDECRRFDRRAHLAGTQIGLAAECPLHLLEESGRPQDVGRLDVNRNRAVELHGCFLPHHPGRLPQPSDRLAYDRTSSTSRAARSPDSIAPSR
jgi:hypothetical protein